MAECQICARDIKDTTGVIAHHGYQRPGNGWQTASCLGARHLSYAKSRDAIAPAIKRIMAWKDGQREYLDKVESGIVPIPSLSRFRPAVQPGDNMYPVRQREHIRRIQGNISSADREIQLLKTRYTNWKKVEE